MCTHNSYAILHVQAPSEDAEPMETGESSSLVRSDSMSESPSLTELDSSKDNFETCLIQLLQAYTNTQRGSSSSPSSSDSTPQTVGGGGQGYVCFDISPESLSSLSSEQVSSLVTSNSINYEVIHQIMTQKQGYHGIPRGVGGAFGANNGDDNNGSLGSSEQSSRQQTPEGASPVPTGPGEGGETEKSTTNDKSSSSSSGDAPLGSPLSLPGQSATATKNSLIQITPEHLQLLQQQVTDLLRSKQVALPPDMTSEQQQMLIQSVLLKQLHLQQQQLKEKYGDVLSSVEPTSSNSTNEGTGPTTSAAAVDAAATASVAKERETKTPAIEGLLSSKDSSQRKENVWHCVYMCILFLVVSASEEEEEVRMRERERERERD